MISSLRRGIVMPYHALNPFDLCPVESNEESKVTLNTLPLTRLANNLINFF